MKIINKNLSKLQIGFLVKSCVVRQIANIYPAGIFWKRTKISGCAAEIRYQK